MTRKPTSEPLPSRRDDLERLRAVLWDALMAADVAVKAQIAGRLQAVIDALAALGSDIREVSAADEIAERRAARRASTATGEPADPRAQSRRRSGGNRTS